MMDMQSAFNIAITIIGVLGGWVFKTISDRLQSLADAQKNLGEKIQHIEVLVAGQYAKKEDVEKATALYKEALDKLTSAIFVKLDRIEEKLDNKMDK
jgi:lipoprotein NlpI